MTFPNTKIQKHKAARLFAPLFFVWACLLTSCGAGPVWQREDPDVVLSGFLVAVESQNTKEMWEYLDPKTRDALQKKADDFNKNPQNGHKRQAWDMLRPGHVMATTREYKRIKLDKADEHSANVDIVLHDDSKVTVTMQRIDNRWTVALPL